MPKPVIDHENFYKAIFQQASEGILLDDGQGNYIEANPEACSMLGYTRDELLNLRVYDIITQESQREDPLHWEQLRRQQTIRLTRSFRRKDGQVIVCDMSARGLNDGTILVILRDVTQSFQTEKELELYTANLTPPAGKKFFRATVRPVCRFTMCLMWLKFRKYKMPLPMQLEWLRLLPLPMAAPSHSPVISAGFAIW